MYAVVLRFLACAILVYEANPATRILQAVWEPKNLEDFEDECTRLASRVETSLNACERELCQGHRQVTEQWRDDFEAELRKLDQLDQLHSIRGSVDALQDKVDLAELAVVKEAIYNSYADGDSPRCLVGTRTELLSQIAQWVDDRHGELIYWLCGKAGTGKSTVSRTVVHTLKQQGRPVATFFFKRGQADRSDAARFFPTIARQFADTIPGLDHSIAAAIAKDSFLSHSALNAQFDKLIFQPFRNMAPTNMPSTDVSLVIDALDECERVSDVGKMLALLSQLESIPGLRLRIFVTSRPDHPTLEGFAEMSGRLHRDIRLEEVQATTIEHDIRLFLKKEFVEIKRKRQRNPYDILPADWPESDSIEALVKLTVPLFIAASTVCRYISESDPRGRLAEIIHHRNHETFSGLERTYLPILGKVVVSDSKRERTRKIEAFRQVIGPIILLGNPLSAVSLSKLLHIPIEKIGEVVTHLHSVLDIPSDANAPIRLFHLSFHDFLLDSETGDSNEFWIDETRVHRELAHKCLQLLNGPGMLRQDICDVEQPGTLRASLGKQQVSKWIPAEVSYACCYLVWHFANGGGKIYDDDVVHEFLKTHLLHWMEALSWLGRISDVIQFLNALRSLVQVSTERALSSTGLGTMRLTLTRSTEGLKCSLSWKMLSASHAKTDTSSNLLPYNYTYQH